MKITIDLNDEDTRAQVKELLIAEMKSLTREEIIEIIERITREEARKKVESFYETPRGQELLKNAANLKTPNVKLPDNKTLRAMAALEIKAGIKEIMEELRVNMKKG